MPIPNYRVVVDWLKTGKLGPSHANSKGWWWCDEASGSLIDFSGQGNDLGAVGSPSYRQAGPKARYLAVGISSGNRFEIADNASLSITGALTLICWVRFNSLLGEQALVTKWKETGNQRSYAFVKEDAPLHRLKARLSVDGIATSVDMAGSAIGATLVWYFIAMRFTPSSEVAIWLDKVKSILTTGIPASIFDSTAKFILGDIEEATRSFNGQLGPGGVFARALSDAEIDRIRDKGPYGDITEDLDWLEPLTIDRGRPSPLDTFKIGTFSFTALNSDKKFTPENTSSPLFPNVGPRRKIQIQAVYSQVPYPFYTGYTKEIKPVPRLGPPKQVVFQCEDAFGLFQEQQIKTVLYINALTGTIINGLLDQINWPSADRFIDAGQMTVKFMAWDEIFVGQALMEIASGEGGQLYIGEDGKVVFEDRHHRAKPPHNAAVATIDNTMEKTMYRLGKDLVRNRMDINVYPRKVGTADAVIGDLKTKPKIATGQTIDFFIYYRDPDTQLPAEAQNVTTPVSGTDYTAHSNSDGTGQVLTGNLTVTFTNFGRSGKWEVTNNGPEAFLTKAQIRGQALTTFDILLVRKEDSATIGQYIAAHILDSRIRQEYEPAVDEANWLLSFLKDEVGYFDVMLSNGKEANFLQCLQREISDRVRIVNTPTSLDENAFIGAILHEITQGGKVLKTTWILEKIGIDGQAFIVGTSTVGSADKVWY